MKSKKSIGLFAQLALFACAIIWGSSFFIMKTALDGVPVTFLISFRFSVAFILLSIIFHKRFKKINKRYIKYGIVMGGIYVVAYIIQTYGLAYTTPGKNAFLTSGYCIMVPFLYWIFSKRRPDVYNYIAAVMLFIGIGFVSLDGISDGFNLGDGLTILSGFFYAVHMVLVARATEDSDPILFTIVQFMFGAIFGWIANFFMGSFYVPELSDPSVLLELLYLAVFASAVCLLFQTFGQKYVNPSQASIITSLESVFGVAFSVIFYSEALSSRLLIGFAIIFVAVIVSETKLSFIFKKKNKAVE